MANYYFCIYVNPPQAHAPDTIIFEKPNKTCFLCLFVCLFVRRCGWKLGHQSPFFLSFFLSFFINPSIESDTPSSATFAQITRRILSVYRTDGLGYFLFEKSVYHVTMLWKIIVYWKKERSFSFATRGKERNPFFALDRNQGKKIPFMVLVIPQRKELQMAFLWSTTCATLNRLCIKCNQEVPFCDEAA